MGIRKGPLRERNSTVNPYWKNDAITLYCGDCREVLRELPDESVHCVITSPPYWGLRDYGVDGQLGLEPTAELYVQHLVDWDRPMPVVAKGCPGTDLLTVQSNAQIVEA